jgi:DNA (cytosine-5)-methyltransferase 1
MTAFYGSLALYNVYMTLRRPVLVDLFCKAGGCSEGYRRAGFDVIGVDIEPQPRYPFRFVLADALRAPIDWRKVDAVHASPPCQAFSAMRVMKNARADHADLLTPMREFLKASGKPYVIENVPGAPMRRDVVLCGSMFGLGTADGEGQLRRHRWFELNWKLSSLVPPCQHDRRKPIEVYGHGDSGRAYRRYRAVTVVSKQGGSSRRDRAIAYTTVERQQAMGIDWMKDYELSQSIPPAYTELIGRQLMRAIGR